MYIINTVVLGENCKRDVFEKRYNEEIIEPKDDLIMCPGKKIVFVESVFYKTLDDLLKEERFILKRDRMDIFGVEVLNFKIYVSEALSYIYKGGKNVTSSTMSTNKEFCQYFDIMEREKEVIDGFSTKDDLNTALKNNETFEVKKICFFYEICSTIYWLTGLNLPINDEIFLSLLENKDILEKTGETIKEKTVSLESFFNLIKEIVPIVLDTINASIDKSNPYHQAFVHFLSELTLEKYFITYQIIVKFKGSLKTLLILKDFELKAPLKYKKLESIPQVTNIQILSAYLRVSNTNPDNNTISTLLRFISQKQDMSLYFLMIFNLRQENSLQRPNSNIYFNVSFDGSIITNSCETEFPILCKERNGSKTTTIYNSKTNISEFDGISASIPQSIKYYI